MTLRGGCGLGVLFCLIGGAPAQPPDLTHTLAAMAAAHAGHVALYAKNLTTGEQIALDADQPVQTASVIKMTLMLQAFTQVKAGRLRLDQRLPLTRDNQVGGSGILNILNPGLELTLHDAITLMMTLSDNTATNMVIDAVGLPPTNAMLARMGMKNTYFYKKVFKPSVGPLPADQPQFGLGKTTAREMAAVLESIERCDLGDAALCHDMITIMRNQQDRDMLPRYLPTSAARDGLSPIADKIGSLDDVRNDVALVYAASGPVIISLFTWGNKDQSWTADNAAELLIGHLAATIVHAWSPDGLASEVH
ncbi:MAG TPA: serine hydrolase [Terriglobales bacterium]|nr:serine hydrolase [Terriglobales bacterium]